MDTINCNHLHITEYFPENDVSGHTIVSLVVAVAFGIIILIIIAAAVLILIVIGHFHNCTCHGILR